MPDPVDPKVLDNLATSIADHSFLKHGYEFRNETSDGASRPSSKSYGDRIEIHSRQDLAEHIKRTVQSPDTKYFIDESLGGRMVFFNEKTGTTVTFNPKQLWDGDGHAGAVMREKTKGLGRTFDKELQASTGRLGYAPEIRSAADGKWSLPANTFDPATARSAAHARVNPPLDRTASPPAKLPDPILKANQLDVIEGVKEISKLAKAGRLGANITGAGIIIGAASVVLMEKAHASQRDLAGKLSVSGTLDKDAYDAYIDLNNETEKLLYSDLAISTADPTGASIIITLGAEGKARGDFKDWADKHAPHLSEAQFQALSMSMFPDNSARANMLWDARNQLPSNIDGQPEHLHEAIELNALYNKASKIGYSHKEGYTYGGNLSQTLNEAKNIGIEVEYDVLNPSKTIQSLRSGIKQELVQELDEQLSSPKTIDSMLNTVPADERLEYVRRLASSEDNPEQFALNHPEVAAYVKAYDKSITGWGWTMKEDDSLLSNPNLLNEYIKDRTLPNLHTLAEMPEQDFSVEGSTYAGSIPIEDAVKAGLSISSELIPQEQKNDTPHTPEPLQQDPSIPQLK